ncbi:MAG: hypothetical protein K2W95_02795 [Candidatus Obscuribacterales bacterium]|nr:hypothetical protein [Candidatus Obscuribacterales bacterium]
MPDKKKSSEQEPGIGILYCDLDENVEESEEGLAAAIGGTTTTKQNQNPLTAGLHSHLEAGSHTEIDNQVSWVTTEIKNDYNATVSEDGYNQENFEGTAAAHANEAASALKDYLEAHNSVLNDAGVEKFVQNWEADTNSRTIESYSNMGYANGGILQGIGQTAAQDWKAEGSDILGESLTQAGASSAAQWGQGYVTGGLQMHGERASTMEVLGEVQAIYSNIEAQDQASGGQFQSYIQAEAGKLAGVLEQNGHELTTAGAQNFDIKLSQAMADSTQLQDAGLNGCPNEADMSNLHAESQANTTLDNHILAEVQNQINSDYKEYGSASSKEFTSAQLNQQAFSAEVSHIEANATISQNNVSALVSSIENADGITLARQEEKIEAQVNTDESSVSQFLGGAAAKELSTVTEQISNEAASLAGTAEQLTHSQETSIIQSIENNDGITRGEQIASLNNTVANESAALVKDGILTDAQASQFTQAAQAQILAEADLNDLTRDVGTLGVSAMLDKANLTSGLTAAIQTDSIAQEMVRENQISASFNPNVSNQTVIADVVAAAGLEVGSRQLHSAQVQQIADQVDAQTGIGTAMEEEIAEGKILNDVSQYGAFDHRIVSMGADGKNIQQVVQNFEEVALAANPSLGTNELTRAIEQRLQLTEAKQTYETLTADIASDQDPLFESKWLSQNETPNDVHEDSILKADAIMMETSQPDMSTSDLIQNVRAIYDLQSNTTAGTIENQIFADAFTKAGKFWNGNMQDFHHNVIEEVKDAMTTDLSTLLSTKGQEKLIYDIEKQNGVLAGEQNVEDIENPLEGATEYLNSHPVLKGMAIAEFELGMGLLTIATMGAGTPAVAVAEATVTVAADVALEVGTDTATEGLEATTEAVVPEAIAEAVGTTGTSGVAATVNSAAASLLSNMTSAIDAAGESLEGIGDMVNNVAGKSLAFGGRYLNNLGQLSFSTLNTIQNATDSVDSHLWDYQEAEWGNGIQQGHNIYNGGPVSAVTNEPLPNSNLNVSVSDDN